MSDWTNLEQLCEAIADCPHSTPKWTEVGVLVLRSQNIRDGRLDLSGMSFTDEAHYLDRSRRAEVRKGDLVITREAPMGEVCIIPAGLRCCLGQRMVLLRPDAKRCDGQFLLYALQSPPVQEQISWSEGTGSTVSNLRIPHLKALRIPTPPMTEQRAIAGVLGALDDKIEQNRQTARALERLARAIFRAWFVDFEPVKAKAAGSTSFPSMPQPVFDALPTRFVDSDIGPVPDGWRVLTIGELAHRIAMGPFGSDIKRENFISEGVPVIRGGNLTDGFVDEDFVYLSEAKADQLRNANAFPGDVVITHRGTLGQVGLIPLKSRYRRYVVSQSQMLIRPNSDALPPHLLYLFLTSAPGQHALLANRSQTGVPAISRPTQSIKAIRFVLADAWFSNAFESMVAALFECRGGIVAESRKLAELRDYLLPKLLSGAVRVKEAERVLETTP